MKRLLIGVLVGLAVFYAAPAQADDMRHQIAKTLRLDAMRPAPRKYRVAPHSVASFPTLFGTGGDIEMRARVNGKPIPEGVIDSGGGFTADFRGRGVWISLVCASPMDCRVQIANSRARTVTVRVAAATS